MKAESSNTSRLIHRTIIWALCALILGVLWMYISRAPSTLNMSVGPPPSPKEGFSAPDFTLELLDGGQITLSGLRGQPVVLNLWTTWCGPCREEMPAIEKVYRDYKDLGLVVIGLNLTSQDSEESVAAFVQELGLSFPIALDRDGSVSNRYQLLGLPTTFFIDREGVIRSMVVGGPMSEALIQSKVKNLLSENP
ncbi:MAG TPA: TlpA family protein disulfide reductase [Anaerolineae bacterium]|nr:TlpA family protein disulfide reductase [Anaerolineae bacterium]